MCKINLTHMYLGSFDGFFIILIDVWLKKRRVLTLIVNLALMDFRKKSDLVEILHSGLVGNSVRPPVINF